MGKDERQELIKQLYCDALERDAGEREAFLAEACAGDEDLRREVETLLGYETEAMNFIETPAMNLAAEILAEQQSDAQIGLQVGAYKIIDKLGAGGMGEVYLAEDARLRRKVALKLLPARFVADSELQRIVTRALEKDRAARYQRCDETLADLKALREEMEFEQKLRGKERERSSGYTTGIMSPQPTGKPAGASKRSWRTLMIGMAILLAVAGGWFYRRAANLKWARNQIPLLEKLAREQKYSDAYDLAAQVREYLPDDSTIARLMPSIADDLSVVSEPAGGRVYLRRFLPDSSKQSSPRQFIGETPINKLRIARGQYILSLEKEGYAPSSVAYFNSLLSHYRYDKSPLDARVIETTETAEWRREKIGSPVIPVVKSIYCGFIQAHSVHSLRDQEINAETDDQD